MKRVYIKYWDGSQNKLLGEVQISYILVKSGTSLTKRVRLYSRSMSRKLPGKFRAGMTIQRLQLGVAPSGQIFRAWNYPVRHALLLHSSTFRRHLYGALRESGHRVKPKHFLSNACFLLSRVELLNSSDEPQQ